MNGDTSAIASGYLAFLNTYDMNKSTVSVKDLPN